MRSNSLCSLLLSILWFACEPPGTVALPAPIACGDGSQTSAEECDDGNNDDGDWCTNDCLRRCGSGTKLDVLVVWRGNEYCIISAALRAAVPSLRTGLETVAPEADAIIAAVLATNRTTNQCAEGFNPQFFATRSCSEACLPPGDCFETFRAVYPLTDSEELADFQTLVVSSGEVFENRDALLCAAWSPFVHDYDACPAAPIPFPLHDNPIFDGEFLREDAVLAVLLVTTVEDCSLLLTPGEDACGWALGPTNFACGWTGHPWPESLDAFTSFYENFRPREATFMAAFVGLDEKGTSIGDVPSDVICTSPSGVEAMPAPRVEALVRSMLPENQYLASVCQDDFSADMFEIGRRLGHMIQPCP